MNTSLARQVVRDPRVTPIIAVVGAMILLVVVLALTLLSSINDLQQIAEDRGRLHEREMRQITELQKERVRQDNEIRRLRRLVAYCDANPLAKRCQIPTPRDERVSP